MGGYQDRVHRNDFLVSFNVGRAIRRPRSKAGPATCLFSLRSHNLCRLHASLHAGEGGVMAMRGDKEQGARHPSPTILLLTNPAPPRHHASFASLLTCLDSRAPPHHRLQGCRKGNSVVLCPPPAPCAPSSTTASTPRALVPPSLPPSPLPRPPPAPPPRQRLYSPNIPRSNGPSYDPRGAPPPCPTPPPCLR